MRSIKLFNDSVCQILQSIQTNPWILTGFNHNISAEKYLLARILIKIGLILEDEQECCTIFRITQIGSTWLKSYGKKMIANPFIIEPKLLEQAVGSRIKQITDNNFYSWGEQI